MNVLLITYRRAKYLKQIIDVLIKNKINIYVYQNKTTLPDEAAENVQRILLQNKDHIKKFIYPNKHLESKQSIEFAVTEFFNLCDKGLILEDDCLPHHKISILLKSIDKYIGSESVFSLYDPNKKTQDGDNIKICLTPYLHVWGWYCKATLWREFLNNHLILEKERLIEFLRTFKVPQTHIIYWCQIFYLVKHQYINSWDYNFWFFLIIKNKNIYSMQGNFICNVGNDEFANFLDKNIDRDDHFYSKNFFDIQNFNQIRNDIKEIGNFSYRIKLLRIIELWIIILKKKCIKYLS